MKGTFFCIFLNHTCDQNKSTTKEQGRENIFDGSILLVSYLEKRWDWGSWVIFSACPNRQLCSCKYVKYPVLLLFLLQQGLYVSLKMAFLEDIIYIVVRDKAGCEELFMNHIKTRKDDIGMKGEMSATYCLLQDQECNQNRTM